MEQKYYVSISSNISGRQAIAWLEAHGYENVQGLTAENYSFPVFMIYGKLFFGSNTTCMAALASIGIRAIPWEEWVAKVSS